MNIEDTYFEEYIESQIFEAQQQGGRSATSTREGLVQQG